MTTTFTVQFFYIPAGKVNAIGHSAFYTERFTILKGTKKEAPWIPRWKSGRNDHSILVKRGTYTYTRNGGENVDIPKVTMRFELEADKDTLRLRNEMFSKKDDKTLEGPPAIGHCDLKFGSTTYRTFLENHTDKMRFYVVMHAQTITE